MEDTTITFRVGDEVFEFDFGDVDGLEARAFRKATDFDLVQAVAMLGDGAISLEMFGGIVWLIKRRENKDLTYEEVLGSVKFNDLLMTEEEPTNPPD